MMIYFFKYSYLFSYLRHPVYTKLGKKIFKTFYIYMIIFSVILLLNTYYIY